MARSKKSRFDGVVVQRELSPDGYIVTSDKNGRICWDSTRRERVVLVQDLRSFGSDLFIGRLGWTVPGSTDGYKWIEVEFDTQQRLVVETYSLSCVNTDQAQVIAQDLVAKYRNTRFDADGATAKRCRKEWIRANYERYISTDELKEMGMGCEEVYAFSFPSMKDIAAMKGEPLFPMKIGYSANQDDGALGRIRSLIFESAAYPEKPSVYLIFRTWNGRQVETAIHKRLGQDDRKVTSALGKEWYRTNTDELIELLNGIDLPQRDKGRPVRGASETIEEGFNEILARGDRLYFQYDKDSASVQFGIESRRDKKET